MGICNLCRNNAIPDDELLEHLRLIHPDSYGTGPQPYPGDGKGIVIMEIVPQSDDEQRPNRREEISHEL